MNEFLPFIVTGVAAGAIYGLAGTGLVLTYRTSGVFNFAHGALATAGAYFFYELHVKHNVPWPVAAVVCVVGLGVVLGLLLEVLGRQLAHVSALMSVVATVGVLLAIQGAATVHYGAQIITLQPYLPTETFRVGGVNVGYDQLIVLLIGVTVSVGLAFMLSRTYLGLSMRGVVDDPALLDMTGMDALLVRRCAWMVGGSIAVLSGILLAPTIGLDPIRLTFLVVQAFGAAAIGRFRSLPLTFVGGIAIGVAASLGQKYASDYPVLLGLPSSIPFIALFVVLVASRPGSLPRGTVAKPHFLPRFTPAPPAVRWSGGLVAVVLLIAVPSLVGTKLPVYINAVGLAVMFLSLGLLVKLAGQVSLCHGAFVAVGAVAFSRLSLDANLPWPVAVLGAGLVAVPIGAIVALPAIRLSGVYLALATFAFALLMENLVYRTFLMFGQQGNRVAPRPDIPGLGVATDREYFYVALLIATACGLLIAVLQRSRLGRLLAGLADSPLALMTFGAGTTTALVLLFSISAFFAGVAGAVISSGTQAAGPAGFGSLQSLLWIAVIAITGAPLVRSAIIAAIALGIGPSYMPSSWNDYLPIFFGVAAVVTAVLAANPINAVNRTKASLRVDADRHALAPIRARQRRDRVTPLRQPRNGGGRRRQSELAGSAVRGGER